MLKASFVIDNMKVSSLAVYLPLIFIFNKEIFTPQDLGVSYTNINYWDKQGILSSSRTGTTAWRKFSFMDYIWLRVIDELRQFGVQTSLIKKAKKVCFEPLPLDYKKLLPQIKNKINSSDNPTPIRSEFKEELFRELDAGKKYSLTYIMYITCLLIKSRRPVSLLLFKDGNCDFYVESEKALADKETTEKRIFQSHISVAFSTIIKDFLMNPDFTFLLPQLPLLQENETRVLELINSGNYDSITIRFKDKKMKSLELRKAQDTKRKVTDILMDGAYQDIVLKSHKGMVTHIENTVKVKFDENELL